MEAYRLRAARKVETGCVTRDRDETGVYQASGTGLLVEVSLWITQK